MKSKRMGHPSVLVIMAATAIGISAPASAQTQPPRNTTPNIPWFSTTFDGMTVEPHPTNPAKTADIVGGNWADIKNKPNDEDMVFPKNGLINYQEGTITQREASITDDPECPANPCNKVLRFNVKSRHIDNPNKSYTDQISGERGIEWKTRIQYEVKARTTNLGSGVPQQKAETPIPGGFPKAYYQKVRVMLGSGFNRVKASNALKQGSWMMLGEFFNDSQQLNFDKQIARIGLRLAKDPQDRRPYSEALQVRNPHNVADRDPLRLSLEMETADTNPQTLLAMNYKRKWTCTNRAYDVPTNRWLTIELYIKEGRTTGTPGRVYLAVTDNGTKTVICNANALTISDASGYMPDGQTAFSPLKFYSYEDVINAANNQTYQDSRYAHTLSVYFDDLDLWFNKVPVGSENGIINLPTDGRNYLYPSGNPG